MATARKVEPFLYGPIGNVIAAPDPGAPLFGGADKLLSRRAQRMRRELLDAAAPFLDRTLGPEEKVIYVAVGARSDKETAVFHVTMGHFAAMMKQVVLVFTTVRIIELEMLGRNKIGTALRSYPWNAIAGLKNSFLSLGVKSTNGKSAAWMVAQDRKAMKLLVPLFNERLAGKGAPWNGAFPVQHCPTCAAFIDREAPACSKCNQHFKTRGTAILVAAAIPGGALHYYGYRGLGLLTGLGEAIIALGALGVLSAASKADAGGIAFGMFLLFALLKAQGIANAFVLAKRKRPMEPGGDGRWFGVAVGGAVATLVVLVMAGMLYTEALKRDPPKREASEQAQEQAPAHPAKAKHRRSH
jgi:hypothetical protein